MKKAILASIITVMTLQVSGQWVKVKEITKLEVKGYHARFVPGSAEIIYSNNNFVGLKSYNLDTQKETVISKDRGAGYQPWVSHDELRFSTRDHRLFSYQFTSQRLEEQGRESFSARQKSQVVSAEVSKDLRSIMVSNSQCIKSIQPLGEGDYLNLSVSPDQSKLMFRVSGLGSFVTDLEGRVLQELGDVEFPGWVDDHTVCFTQTEDDGVNYVSSSLVVASLDQLTSSVVLTDPQKHIALYPTVDDEGARILFHTPQGELYLIGLDRSK